MKRRPVSKRYSNKLFKKTISRPSNAGPVKNTRGGRKI